MSFLDSVDSFLGINTTQNYQSTAVDAAQVYGVPPDLFSKLIQTESGFNAYAVNPQSGATGIAQFLPSTAANPGYGISPFDPTDAYSSLFSGAQYLQQLYRNTGSWTGAVASYQGIQGGAAGLGSASLTPSQQQLYSLANQIDQGAASGNTSVNAGTGGFTSGIINSITGINLPSSVASLKGNTDTQSTTLATWLERIAIVVIGIIVISVALKALTGKDNVVVKLIGNKEVLHGASGQL